MRNVAFLAVGLALLVVQDNVFRAIDGARPGIAAFLWVIAVAADALRTVRPMRGFPAPARALSSFRADWSLPATALLGYALVSAAAKSPMGRPIPALVLPLILFMGVHEYSLARGAAVAFVLGYATDVLGIAPVGLYTFTYVATFVLARAAGVRLATQTSWMQVLVVFAFTLVQSTMILVLLAIFGRDAWVPRSLYRLSIPHAIATAAIAPIAFRIAQAIHAATADASRAEGGAGAPI
ncbi:MAG TPA: rod shape-determining protein MreD [Polyangiaceae bacterium]|jgi:rod shape-determining protein MreD